MVSCHFQRSICDPLKAITITIALLRRCHSIINNIPPSQNTNNLSYSRQGWYCWTQVKKFFVVEICFSFLLKIKCSPLPPLRDLLKVIISCSLGYFNKTVNFCWLMLLVMKCFEFSIKRVLPVPGHSIFCYCMAGKGKHGNPSSCFQWSELKTLSVKISIHLALKESL